LNSVVELHPAGKSSGKNGLVVSSKCFVTEHGSSMFRAQEVNDWQIILTLSGSACLKCSAGDISLSSGDVVLLQPGVLQHYSVPPSVEGWKSVLVHFHPRQVWLEWLRWPETARGIALLQLSDKAARARITQRLIDVDQHAQSGARHGNELATNALEEVLLLCDNINPMSLMSHMDARVQKAAEYIINNISDVLDVRVLADVSDCSVSRIAHLFREQVGKSVQQFIELQRINRARELLASTSRTVQDIAMEVGYDNPLYFSSRFRKVSQFSPTEYRKLFS